MLYLHIPYCKQACSYCNFHFSTNLKTRSAMLAAIVAELSQRRGELPPGNVPTIYLGGGTPSLLTGEELDFLFSAIVKAGYWDGSSEAEITLEANPDDLDAETVARLAASPVNRLSIGVQSFHEADLRFMNRAHTAAEARESLARVAEAGFRDFSIDLIYGGPTTTDEMWEENLRLTTELGVTHVSAYALTVEEGTALGHAVKKGKIAPPDDRRFAAQFGRMVEVFEQDGFEHYEISNFARPGHRSRHNSGYWSGQPYLGVGPGAHSFNGSDRRRWNVSNNALYLKGQGTAYEEEVLSPRERYNETIMVALRRMEGIDLSELETRFGKDYRLLFERSVAAFVASGDLVHDTATDRYTLSREGRMLADGIAAAAFALEE